MNYILERVGEALGKGARFFCAMCQGSMWEGTYRWSLFGASVVEDEEGGM